MAIHYLHIKRYLLNITIISNAVHQLELKMAKVLILLYIPKRKQGLKTTERTQSNALSIKSPLKHKKYIHSQLYKPQILTSLKLVLLTKTICRQLIVHRKKFGGEKFWQTIQVKSIGKEKFGE